MTTHTPVFILSELVILPNQDVKIDVSNEGSKKVIKEASKNNDSQVLVIAPKNTLESTFAIEDLPSIGVVAKIRSKLELSSGNIRIVLRGLKRVKVTKYFQNRKTNILKCSYDLVQILDYDTTKEIAIKRKLISLTHKYIEINKSISNSILQSLREENDLNFLTDLITSFMPFPFIKKLEYMENINPINRASSLIEDLQSEINISDIDRQIDEKLQENLENSQREYILKEKLKEINNELGNDKNIEINELTEKLENLQIDLLTKNKLMLEIKKYSISSDYSPESSVLKNYLETVINLPWQKEDKENDDIKDIAKKLNESHFGLKEVKERIVEYIALKENSPLLSAPIICLVGPPGVGKTSIAMSIANSLNRKFYKISVGGLNDSTELIGSRKTYLGAAPGKIIQAIIKCDSSNPLILIDEVDKMVKDYKGDPASTLLEILDESQNKYFTDNYIEEPFDLSKVMFILTANEIDKIPHTLLDRLEIIQIDSYSLYEKIDIAKNYLLKDIFSKYNLSLKVQKETLEYIVSNYTKEPGVRELKRILEKLVRKIYVYEKELKSITMTMANKYLGKEIDNYIPKIRDYGIANTLAYTAIGGQVSHVEVAKVKGSGKIDVTGSVGTILKESVMVVKGYLASEYEIEVNNFDIFVHFMSASQKKDGPSAGISIAVAMLSLFKKKLISGDIAFTGEITLKGDILPIAGLKEKLIAAASNNIKTVFIPKANEMDLINIPEHIFDKVAIKLVSNFSEIYSELFHF